MERSQRLTWKLKQGDSSTRSARLGWKGWMLNKEKWISNTEQGMTNFPYPIPARSERIVKAAIIWVLQNRWLGMPPPESTCSCHLDWPLGNGEISLSNPESITRRCFDSTPQSLYQITSIHLQIFVLKIIVQLCKYLVANALYNYQQLLCLTGEWIESPVTVSAIH